MDKKIETKTIPCDKVNEDVSLEYKYVAVFLSSGSDASEKLAGFDCLNKLNCPTVTKIKGEMVMVDWKFCPYYPNKKI
jgi:hypothetical protein